MLKNILFNPLKTLLLSLILFVCALIDSLINNASDFSHLTLFGKTMTILFCVGLFWTVVIRFIKK